jgi:hypothetical protein
MADYLTLTPFARQKQGNCGDNGNFSGLRPKLWATKRDFGCILKKWGVGRRVVTSPQKTAAKLSRKFLNNSLYYFLFPLLLGAFVLP